ncbi:MAG: metalloregulator ArsR/SmtB family transcription factor [Bacteroidales bacterium]
MNNKDYNINQKKIALIAKALGHPARIAILEFLAAQNTCFFGDIHEVLPISKSTVSQHLKELKNAKLIRGKIEAPKVKYCIDSENWNYAKALFANFFNEYNKK